MNLKSVMKWMIAIATLITALITILNFFGYSTIGYKSNYEIDGIFPVKIADKYNKSTKVIYPDRGNWRDSLGDELLYGFATKIHLENTDDNSLPFDKVTLHAENIKVNQNPYIIGACGLGTDGVDYSGTELTIRFRNVGWGSARNIKLYIELENGFDDGEGPELLFGWTKKQVDYEELTAGQQIKYKILGIEDFQISISYEHFYHVAIYYSLGDGEKIRLVGCDLLIDPDGLGIAGGGELPDSNEGAVSAVMTIPTSNNKYSKDFYVDNMSATSVSAHDSNFFNFLVLPDKSCELDIWFEVALTNGKVLKTQKVSGIKVRVPYFENDNFVNADGLNPAEVSIANLYGE